MSIGGIEIFKSKSGYRVIHIAFDFRKEAPEAMRRLLEESDETFGQGTSIDIWGDSCNYASCADSGHLFAGISRLSHKNPRHKMNETLDEIIRY